MTDLDSAAAAAKYEVGTMDDGTRYIFVSGEFAYEDRLSVFEDLARQHRPSFVTFDSPGGNIYSAMALGEAIRRLNLDTLQMKRLECASACSLAFLGGSRRFAEAGSIGVHKSSFLNSQNMNHDNAVSEIQSATRDSSNKPGSAPILEM